MANFSQLNNSVVKGWYFLVLFLISIRSFSRVVDESGALDSIISGILLCLIVLVLVVSRMLFSHKQIFLILILFLGALNYSFSAMEFSLPMEQGMVSLSRLSIVLGLFFVGSAFGQRESIPVDYFLRKYFIVTFGLLFVFFAYGEIHNLVVNIQGVQRSAFPFSNPNVLGGFCVLLTYIVFVVNRSYLGQFLGVAILSYMIVKSGSLTSLFGFFALVLTSVWTDRGRYVKFAAIVCIIISVVLVFDSISSVFFGRHVDDVGNGLKEGSSVVWRITAWGHYLAILKEAEGIFLGLGLGGSRTVLQVGEFFQSRVFFAPNTHSDFIFVLFDFGVVGFIGFIYIVVQLMYKFWKQRLVRRNRISFLFLGSICLMMLFDNYLETFIGYNIGFIVGLIHGSFEREVDDT